MRPLLAAACTASAGLALMALEICGPRLLAPAFGSGTIVWSVIIAGVMLALAVGSLLGGRWSERPPSPRGVGLLLGGATLATAIGPFASGPLGIWTSGLLPLTPLGQLTALVITCGLLFVVPGLLSAAVFPLCLRACTPSVERAGAAYARLYAASTLGSLAGVLLPPLLLVERIGTRDSVLVSCIPAFTCSGILLVGAGGGAVLALLAAAGGLLAARPPTATAWESAYGRYAIVDRAEERTLQVDDTLSYSVYRPSLEVTGHYYDAYLAAPALAGAGPPRRIAVIGVAGGTLLHLFRRAWPEAEIHAVDIDPSLIAAAPSFGLDASAIDCGDGRCWLRRVEGAYDLVAVDTMVTGTPPLHMMSREFFSELVNHLAPRGVVAVNGLPPLDARIAASLATALPHAALLQNVAVGARVPLSPSSLTGALPWPAWPARARDLQYGFRPVPEVASLTDDEGTLPWWWGLHVGP